ncbi:unnamed protein product [[Candida] boidinii]|nr:unnamed protein product [[Candida] boidinii]
MVYTGYFYAPVDGDYKFQVPLIHVGANVGFYVGSQSADMDCCGAVFGGKGEYDALLVNLDITIINAITKTQYLKKGYYPVKVVSAKKSSAIDIGLSVEIPGSAADSLDNHIKNYPYGFACKNIQSLYAPSSFPNKAVTITESGTIPYQTATLEATGTIPENTVTLNATGSLPDKGITLIESGTIPEKTATLGATGTIPNESATAPFTKTSSTVFASSSVNAS